MSGRTQGGYLLVEVMVAVILVGLIVGPLATALSGQVARARETRAAGSSEDQTIADAGDPSGTWGPHVVDASWRPGPVLQVRASESSTSERAAYVGLWVDGWLVSETQVPAVSAQGVAVDTTMGPDTWSGRAGGEAVLRVRSAGGAWGPPWRSSVPGLSGASPAPGGESAGQIRPGIVVHRPATGTSALTVSWSPIALSAPSFGLLFAQESPVAGWGSAVLDGRGQCWMMEDARDLDLFY